MPLPAASIITDMMLLASTSWPSTPAWMELEKAEVQATNFAAAELNAKEAYFYACQSLDVGHNSRDVDLTYEQYCNNSTFWAWTLSPDMDGNSVVNGVQGLYNVSVVEAVYTVRQR